MRVMNEHAAPGRDGTVRDEQERTPSERNQASRSPSQRRRSRRPWSRQAVETTKLRLHYDVSETQLRMTVRKATRLGGDPGEALLRILERRLDNVTFRLGLAPSVSDARDLIRHGHVTVDGRRVSMPSYLVSPGELVEVHPSSRGRTSIVASTTAGPAVPLPSYLQLSPDHMGGRCVGDPTRADVPMHVREGLVVARFVR